MSLLTSAWLSWAALGVCVAVIGAYAVGALLRASVETGIVMFAVGMAWSASTPVVLRWVGRRRG